MRGMFRTLEGENHEENEDSNRGRRSFDSKKL